MSKTRINYKSDFSLDVTFAINSVAVPLPTNDFLVQFFVDGAPGTTYVCGHKGGEYINSEKKDNDTLTCYIDNHKFGCGRLCCEFVDLEDNESFTDGVQKTVTPSRLDIVLVEGAGDSSTNVSASVLVDIEAVISDLRDALDGIEEMQDDIEDLQGDISGLETALEGKVSKTDIADNLTTNSATKVLSAKQGKVLNEKKLDYYDAGWVGSVSTRTASNFNAMLAVITDGEKVIKLGKYLIGIDVYDSNNISYTYNDGFFVHQGMITLTGSSVTWDETQIVMATNDDVSGLGTRTTALEGKFTSLATTSGAAMVGYSNSDPTYSGRTKLNTVLDKLISSTPKYQSISWFESASPTVQNFEGLVDAIEKHKILTLEGMPASSARVVDDNTVSVVLNVGNYVRTYTVVKSGSTINVGRIDTEMQGKLVSGQSIKTVNNQSLLGAGNITIQGGGGASVQSYIDYAEMIADTTQGTGTIGFVEDEEQFYLYDSVGEEWHRASDETLMVTISYDSQFDVYTSDTTFNKIAETIADGKHIIAMYDSQAYELNEAGDVYLGFERVERDATYKRIRISNANSVTYSSGNILTSGTNIKTVNNTSLVGSGNVSTETPVVEVSGATVTQTLSPNTFYKFTGAVTSLTLTLGSEVSGITNIFAFSFTAGADNPTITLPQSVTIADAPTINNGDYVEFNILNGKAVAKVWSA